MSEQEKLKEQIKRRLHGYIDRRYECQQLEQQLQQLEATMTAPRSQAMDGMPKGPGGGDAMAAVVAELIGLQEKYTTKLKQLLAAQKEVEELIDSLEDTVERQVMRCRYIEGKVWEEVCVVMNYSWKQTHRYHSRALNKLVEAEMERQGFRPDIDIVDEWSAMPGVAEAVHHAAVQYAVLGKVTKR